MISSTKFFYERLTAKEREIMALKEHIKAQDKAIALLMDEMSERIGSEELIKSPRAVVLDRVREKLPHKAEDFQEWYHELLEGWEEGEGRSREDDCYDAFNAGISYAQGAGRTG